MGNEALRSSRNSTSSPFRRSSKRQSKNQSSLTSNQGGSGGGASSTGGQAYIPEDEIDRNNNLNQELSTPKPARRMDKIRRSLSFRRKKKSDKNTTTNNNNSTIISNNNSNSNNNNNNKSSNSSTSDPISKSKSDNNQNATSSNNQPNDQINKSDSNNNNNSTTTTTNSNGAVVVARPALWIEDEKRVRAGNCSFQVKYLGAQEVSDSRGMHICEMAIEKLLAEKDKKKPIKAILYVSGDSLRVVDESNKTLLVDQTIEKVSFCAPDRHHENGFAYICRDGTTRRWLCHGFMAIKDTLKGTSSGGAPGVGCSGGERLSHAVGCAFSVCLEKKQKRERENVSMEVGPNHSFTRLGSFRQASLTERFEDPQMVMPAAQPVPIKAVDNPHAIERPKANPEFNRQNSLRLSGGAGALPLPFKRNAPGYTSLKPGELPSFQQQKIASGFNVNNSNNSNQVTKTSLLMQHHQQIQQQQQLQTRSATVIQSEKSNLFNTISELPEETNTNDNSTQLTEQLNKQLTFEQNNNTVPTEWKNSTPNQQQQLFNQTVFATPQSMPMTPPLQPVQAPAVVHPPSTVTTPPPLPPMPTQYIQPATTIPTALFYQQHTTPIAQLPVQYTTAAAVPIQYAQTVPAAVAAQFFSTPNSSIASPSITSLSYSSNATITNPLVSTSTTPIIQANNPNETFEQKWARMQAAKKTNPFADDIAKKFEIKL